MTTRRRRTNWIDKLLDEQITVGSQANIDLLDQVPADYSVRNATVVRMIFDYSISPLIPGQTEAVNHVELGAGVVSQESFLAGVVPDPNTSLDFPLGGWMYRTRHRVQDALVPLSEPISGVFRDIRAQRKLGAGKLFLAVNNTTDVGPTFTVVVLGIVRTLILEP